MIPKKKIIEIAEFIKTGKTPPTEEIKYFNGDINWYTPGDLDRSKFLGSSARKLSHLALEENKATVFPENTLLIGCIGDIGKLGITTDKCSSNQQITGIFPKQNVDVNYLFYWFIANKKTLESFSNNAVVPILNNRILSAIEIPLPALSTQKHIAAILDSADLYRQKTRTLVEKYDQLAQSLFLEMFGDPVRNELGWKTVKLNSIVSKLATGKSLISVDANESGDYKVLKTSSVSWGEFKESEAKFLPYGYIAPTDHLINKGDLLMSRMNTTDLVGASAYVHCETRNLALPDRIWKFIWKNSQNQNTLFIWYTINKKSFRERISKVSSGTSGSMKNISKEKILGLDIIIPPISLQTQFATRIQLIEAQKQQAQSSLQKAETLFNSLLQGAFKGELVK